MMADVQQPHLTTADPLPDLIRALQTGAVMERLMAAKGLGRLGWLAREALPALAETLKDEDGRVRDASAHAVGAMGPDALPTLSRMLQHSDKYVRRQAVWAMGKLGPLASSVLRDLCDALHDNDPRTACGAAQAIGAMGCDGAEGVPALAEAMRGTNIVLCRLAAKALSQVGTPALSTLMAHLQHSDPFVRGESALAIGWMGPLARPAVPFLAKIVRGRRQNFTPLPPPVSPSVSPLRSPSSKVWCLDPPEGNERMSNVPTPLHNTNPLPEAGTPEECSRVHAAQALGRIGPDAALAIEDLREVMFTGFDALRRTAQVAIRQIREE